MFLSSSSPLSLPLTLLLIHTLALHLLCLPSLTCTSLPDAQSSSSSAVAAAEATYKAATVQFSPVGDWTTDPHVMIADNLEKMRGFLQQAQQQGVQIIVFPEGGFGMFTAEDWNTRDAMLPYCTNIPNMSAPSHMLNPCNYFNQQPPVNDSNYQLYMMSCLAAEYELYISFNTCDVQACSNATDPLCPADQRYQYNTQVIFDRKGTILNKYHKAHLFGGAAVFDQAVAEPVTITTDFGVEFGVLICFDMEFAQPTQQLIKLGITDILFSSYWVNDLPTSNALMQQQSYSRTYGVNLLASNVGADYSSSGGGIYTRGRVLQQLWNTTKLPVDQMLVAQLPIFSKSTLDNEHSDDHAHPHHHHHHHHDDHDLQYAQHIQQQINEKYQPTPVIAPEFQPCFPNQLFTQSPANCSLITINSSISSFYSISQGSISCEVAFAASASEASDDFVILAFEGTLHFPYTIDALSLQVCGIFHCNTQSRSSAHSTSSSDVPLCQPDIFTARAPFNSFSIRMNNIQGNTTLFPMLAVDSGTLLDASTTYFYDSHPPVAAHHKQSHEQLHDILKHNNINSAHHASDSNIHSGVSDASPSTPTSPRTASYSSDPQNWAGPHNIWAATLYGVKPTA